MSTNPINLNKLSAPQVRECLDSFDVIFTDCDGVLWHDNEIIPGAAETINAFKKMGKQVYFVTNNGTKTRSELCQKAKAMNFNIEEDDILAPTYSIAHYLKTQLTQDQKVYIIGTESISKELNSLNIQSFGVGPDTVEGKWFDVIQEIDEQAKSDNIGAVVVGFDDHLSYCKMMRASNFLGQNEKCIFLATNSDAVVKFPNYCIPGTGAILKAIETCVGREAFVMGKPNPLICKHLIESGKVNPKRTLMIGDCYKVDVLFGKKCNFHTMLVGSGRYKWQDVEQVLRAGVSDCIPEFYIKSLGDFKVFL